MTFDYYIVEPGIYKTEKEAVYRFRKETASTIYGIMEKETKEQDGETK